MKRAEVLSVVALLSVVAADARVRQIGQKIRDEKWPKFGLLEKARRLLRRRARIRLWREQGLGSPEALIKVFVASRTASRWWIGARDAGLQSERSLAASGDLRGSSNVGQGQIKAADTSWCRSDLLDNKAGATGRWFFRRPRRGPQGRHGSRRHQHQEEDGGRGPALTDVRSSEQVATVKGHARRPTSDGEAAAPFLPRAVSARRRLRLLEHRDRPGHHAGYCRRTPTWSITGWPAR